MTEHTEPLSPRPAGESEGAAGLDSEQAIAMKNDPYYHSLSPKERLLYLAALEIPAEAGLDPEIQLVKVKILSLYNRDPSSHDLKPMLKLLTQLERTNIIIKRRVSEQSALGVGPKNGGTSK